MEWLDIIGMLYKHKNKIIWKNVFPKLQFVKGKLRSQHISKNFNCEQLPFYVMNKIKSFVIYFSWISHRDIIPLESISQKASLNFLQYNFVQN